MKNTILLFSALLLMPAMGKCATTGAEFLEIGTDARLGAMGSAGAAAAGGINALAYNPAGLTAVNSAELLFSHSNWLMGSRHDYIGIGLPALKGGLGIGVTRLSNGSMEGRGADGSLTGGYSAYDQAVSVGYGYGGFGMAVKYIQSSIAGSHAQALAVDLGGRGKLKALPVTLGLGVRNLGSGIKYLSQRDNLPLSVAAGASADIVAGIGLSVEVERMVYDKRTVISAGTEYAVMRGDDLGFELRGGYGLAGSVGQSSGAGFSFGGGLRALGARLDYAVTPQTGLGSVQRITLEKRF